LARGRAVALDGVPRAPCAGEAGRAAGVRDAEVGLATGARAAEEVGRARAAGALDGVAPDRAAGDAVVGARLTGVAEGRGGFVRAGVAREGRATLVGLLAAEPDGRRAPEGAAAAPRRFALGASMVDRDGRAEGSSRERAAPVGRPAA
jgi:hypothetical protein